MADEIGGFTIKYAELPEYEENGNVKTVTSVSVRIDDAEFDKLQSIIQGFLNEGETVEGLTCPNKKCICNNEPVDYKFQLSEGGVYRCLYCSTKAE